MIRLERPAPPAAFLKAARKERALAAKFFKQHPLKRSEKRFNFKAFALLSVRQKLVQFKCAICESHESDHSKLAIHPYRPLWGTKDRKGELHRDLYWWLASNWNNFLPLCSDCQRRAGTRFPLEDEGQRATGPGGEKREKPLLLNPYDDDVERHLVFTEEGLVVPRVKRGRPDPRAEATIETFGLNRPDLVDRRSRSAEYLLQMLRDYEAKIAAAKKAGPSRLKSLGAKLRDELGNILSTEFAWIGQARQFVREWLRTMEPAVQRILMPERTDWWFDAVKDFSISTTKPDRERGLEHYRKLPSRRTAVQTAIWIKRIEIQNFKSIAKLDLSIAERGESWPWLVLLGENSAGKTSVLEAVAVALADDDYLATLGLEAAGFLRRVPKGKGRQPTRGLIRISFSGGPDPVEVTFSRRGVRRKAQRSPVLLMGYGATRLLPRPAHEPEPDQSWQTRVGNLFNPFLPLRRPAAWLTNRKQISQREFGDINVVLGRILPDVPAGWLLRTKRDVSAIENGTPVSLLALSAGYQTVLALTLDIYKNLRRHSKAMDLAEGVVLLDEVGEHLHPRWKKRVVEDLRRVFPRVQFITTTHDPLCLRGLRAGEVVLMRRSANRVISVTTDLPAPDGMRVDQLLTSEFFGLGSVFSEETQSAFDGYYSLVGKQGLTAAEQKKLAALTPKLDTLEVLGGTQRERLMLETIERHIAGSNVTSKDESRRAVRQGMRQELQKVWQNLELA